MRTSQDSIKATATLTKILSPKPWNALKSKKMRALNPYNPNCLNPKPISKQNPMTPTDWRVEVVAVRGAGCFRLAL